MTALCRKRLACGEESFLNNLVKMFKLPALTLALGQPPAQSLLSTRKTGVVPKPYTPPPRRTGFTAGRVGTEPEEASRPIQSRQEEGQGRDDLAGLCTNWLWVEKLPSVGQGLSGGLASHLARRGPVRIQKANSSIAKARGGGCHPGLTQHELAYTPNCL